MRIYGPYYRKDGRQHVVLVFPDGIRRTVSYPKFLKEQALGRLLDPNQETIDHLDRNPNNNKPLNLRILPRPEHAAEDVTRVELVDTNCITCGESLKRRPNDLENNAKRGKAGPFCKSCAGHYGVHIQQGGSRLPPQSGCPIVSRVYYKREKTGV